jgi:hypothetical protein
VRERSKPLVNPCGVTELIKVVIKCSQAAVRCKSECKKLQQELVIIVPDVERIEKRLAVLREANRGDAHEGGCANDGRLVEEAQGRDQWRQSRRPQVQQRQVQTGQAQALCAARVAVQCHYGPRTVAPVAVSAPQKPDARPAAGDVASAAELV